MKEEAEGKSSKSKKERKDADEKKDIPEKKNRREKETERNRQKDQRKRSEGRAKRDAGEKRHRREKDKVSKNEADNSERNDNWDQKRKRDEKIDVKETKERKKRRKRQETSESSSSSKSSSPKQERVTTTPQQPPPQPQMTPQQQEQQYQQWQQWQSQQQAHQEHVKRWHDWQAYVYQQQQQAAAAHAHAAAQHHAQLEYARRQQEEDERRRREEEKRRDEEERRQRELKRKEDEAVRLIMDEVRKVRAATPETFDVLKRDLDRVLQRELDRTGPRRQDMVKETIAALDQGKKSVEQVKQARVEAAAKAGAALLASSLPGMSMPRLPVLPVLQAGVPGAPCTSAQPVLPMLGAPLSQVVGLLPQAGATALLAQAEFSKAKGVSNGAPFMVPPGAPGSVIQPQLLSSLAPGTGVASGLVPVQGKSALSQIMLPRGGPALPRLPIIVPSKSALHTAQQAVPPPALPPTTSVLFAPPLAAPLVTVATPGAHQAKVETIEIRDDDVASDKAFDKSAISEQKAKAKPQIVINVGQKLGPAEGEL